MSYFKKRPAAMGWIPGAVLATAGNQSQPLHAPQPAYGTMPGETPPTQSTGSGIIDWLTGGDTPTPAPASSPYVPAPGAPAARGGLNKNLIIIGALAVGALIALQK